MNRKETNEEFLSLVDKLKSKISNLKLSTISLSVPERDRKQYNHTVEACQKIGLKKPMLTNIRLAPAPVSAKMTDDVPREEKCAAGTPRYPN